MAARFARILVSAAMLAAAVLAFGALTAHTASADHAHVVADWTTPATTASDDWETPNQS